MHDSGQTHRTGHITKEGRKELRYVLVEAAWHAVETNDFWKAEFERLCRPPAAWSATRPHLHLRCAWCSAGVVTIARQLLVVIWHVLTERAAGQHADPDRVAFKLMTWSWKLTNEQRGGLTTRQFVRYQLLRLGLGHDLTHVVRGGGKYLIAPPDEVLRLKPELHAAA